MTTLSLVINYFDSAFMNTRAGHSSKWFWHKSTKFINIGNYLYRADALYLGFSQAELIAR